MIEKRPRTKNGKVVGNAWRVRWVGADGAKHSETFQKWKDADLRDKEIALARSRGEEWRLVAAKTTFYAFVELEYDKNVWPHLATNTRKVHRQQMKKVVGFFGNYQLREIRPKTVSDFKQKLTSDGAGDPTIRRTLTVLQGVLEHAVSLEYISINPARAIKKPSATKRVIAPPVPGPQIVEKVRAELLAKNREMDAVLVSVLAYAGLRPMEALALTWGDVFPGFIRVDKALSDRKPKPPKTTRGNRKVDLLPALGSDLTSWRKATLHPGADEPLFYSRDGGYWSEYSYRNWRRRHYQPAAKNAGLNSLRPYDLRHSFASLLIQEQRLSSLEIAYQMGHEMTMTETTYAKVIDQFRGAGAVAPNAAIAKARKSASTNRKNTGRK